MFDMPHSTKTRLPRAKLSQTVRVRPYQSQLPAEICVTENVSRRGFYFETSLRHYFVGMYVHVTRNFHAGDLMSGEEPGDVVRVESLRNGKCGVALRILAGDSCPRVLEPAAANFFEKQEHRRTRRARVKIPLLIYGNTPDNKPFFEESHTIEINAHGALVATKITVRPGDHLLLTNEINDESQECIVLAVRSKQRPDTEAVAVTFSTPAPWFWRPRSPLVSH